MFSYVCAFVCVFVCMYVCTYVLRMYEQQDYIHPVILHNNHQRDPHNPYDPLTTVI